MLPINRIKFHSYRQEVVAQAFISELYYNHMLKHAFHGIGHFVRKHLILFIVIPVAVAGCLVGIFLYAQHQDQATARLLAETDARLMELDRVIAEVKARKEAEAAAALKAEQEAAAKLAAEQAKTATATTSGAIDSSACNTSTTHNDPSSIDVLVNKKHCIQPLAYAPIDLEYIPGTSFQLSAKAIPQLQAMINAAQTAGGLAVTSSYRSYATQITTYNYWVSVSGKDGADTYSARPGYSEHQTGFAIDFKASDSGKSLSDFAGTTQDLWLQAHAHEYGFIQRYIAGYESITGYGAEEWHYRYVGVAVATDMKARGVYTLEEYWDLSGGDY